MLHAKRRGLALAALIALVSISFGCAGGGAGGSRTKPSIDHEHTLLPGRAHHPGITKALVLPINATVRRETGLDAGDEAIMRLLTEYLAKHGIESEMLEGSDFNRATQAARSRARKKQLSGESGVTSQQLTLENVLPEMLAELGTDAQIVVVPSVVMRTATYKNRANLRWDGVRRRERGVGGFSSMEGSIPAGSLMTAVFEPTGERVFMGYGGLDLLFELNKREKKYDLRADLFQDEENLAEGVCVSLHPYFGNEDDC